MRAIVILVLFSTLAACKKRPEIKKESGTAMGTSWTLVVLETGSASRRGLVSRVLEEQEAKFSNWREASEVSRVERGELEASRELIELLELAERVKVGSGGAFDVRWRGRLDLGGVAKGWAVDQVAEVLAREGVSHFVFELGGEVIAQGNGPDGNGWEVGIEKPSPAGGRLVKKIRLFNEALATSGNYHQPQHLKDGRTGEVLGGELRSVSVVMPTCAEADAWATALFVLGEEPEGFAGRVLRN